MVNVFIDDERFCAYEDWITVRTSREAIATLTCLKLMGIGLDEISFDHDLGGEDTTRHIVIWMIENEYFPRKTYVHSMNPIGRDWLCGMINKYFPM